MGLQWYPGHMTKARRELAALMPSQDVVVEVLDARLPGASSNPVLEALRGAKPCVKVLTRSDLADPEQTRAWLAHFGQERNVSAFAASKDRPDETRKRIHALCKDTARARGPDKAVRALILGVPNVGKSTLINLLMQKKIAAVGDKPAVTKAQQSVVLKNGMKLTDSPGLMWPKIEDERSALMLALAGSIPDTAIDYLTTAMFGAELLLGAYPALIASHYKLSEIPASPQTLLEHIGRRSGGLRAGGVIDMNKAAELFVHAFRAGVIGRMTLERPSS
ncbi:MAG: ribosome biogenesis GTPase YlqF [Polyangiales bacterium]